MYAHLRLSFDANLANELQLSQAKICVKLKLVLHTEDTQRAQVLKTVNFAKLSPFRETLATVPRSTVVHEKTGRRRFNKTSSSTFLSDVSPISATCFFPASKEKKTEKF
jgi:hypothetical protein